MKNNKNLKRFECRNKAYRETSKKNVKTSKKFYDNFDKKNQELIYDKDTKPIDKYNFAINQYSKNVSKDINSLNNYTTMYNKCDKIKNK